METHLDFSIICITIQKLSIKYFNTMMYIKMLLEGFMFYKFYENEIFRNYSNYEIFDERAGTYIYYNPHITYANYKNEFNIFKKDNIKVDNKTCIYYDKYILYKDIHKRIYNNFNTLQNRTIIKRLSKYTSNEVILLNNFLDYILEFCNNIVEYVTTRKYKMITDHRKKKTTIMNAIKKLRKQIYKEKCIYKPKLKEIYINLLCNRIKLSNELVLIIIKYIIEE